VIIYPNVAEFDFFEKERQKLLEEFDFIADGFVCKLKLLENHQHENKGE
jgi:hypothetical protein